MKWALIAIGAFAWLFVLPAVVAIGTAVGTVAILLTVAAYAYLTFVLLRALARWYLRRYPAGR